MCHYIFNTLLYSLSLNRSYELGLGPTTPQVLLLWEALRRFTNVQRALFLRFVWGRSRLPESAKDFSRPLTISPLVQYGGLTYDVDADTLLPQAHTCFFRLILPPWKTQKAAQDRLLYAITYCKSMDTDFDASAPDISARSAWQLR